MDTSNIISIIDIFVTSIIGIWIASSVQINLSTNRALKDHLIEEVKYINSNYRSFLDSLYKGKSNAKHIQEWLKVMNIRIETIEQSILDELNLIPFLLPNHIELKRFLTDTPEFNDSYDEDTVELAPATKNKGLEIHTKYSSAIIKLIININKCSRRKIGLLH